MKWFRNRYGQLSLPRKQSARRRASFRPQLVSIGTSEVSLGNPAVGLRGQSVASRRNQCRQRRQCLRFRVERNQALGLRGPEEPLVGSNQNEVFAVGAELSCDSQRRF